MNRNRNPLKNQPLDVRFWARVDKRGPDECWPWLGRFDRDGYGNITAGSTSYRATHVSLTLDGKPRPSRKHGACHSCDNPKCVNPAHLWWGTHARNMEDMARKGRAKEMQGEANPGAKLTAIEVDEIRALGGKVSQAQLGKRFGVRPNTIWYILSGRKWKHVGTQP